MLKNYLKVALRKLLKNKLDTVISIGGLALGIACCILLVLFVHFEWSFDNFHTQSDRIYRVVTQVTDDEGSTRHLASSPYAMGPELMVDYPELEEFVRIHRAEVELKRGSEYGTQRVLFADSAFFGMFTFPLLSGSPGAVLDGPGNVVLTESKARELFGPEDAVGEELTLKLYDEERTYRVAGVVADPPANSSFSFGMVMPYENYGLTISPLFRRILPQQWDVTMGETFVLLHPSADKTALEAKLPDFAEEHYGEGPRRDILLQPLEEIYLDPEVSSTITVTSSPAYSWILAGIAVVVLVIACINFMSLTLSRSSVRASEIGIRKASGAGRRELTVQFLGEAFITCCIAFVLGIILSELALPYLRQLVGKPVPFALFGDPSLWLTLGGLVIVSALITGLYPALVMSRKNASESLKGNRSAERIPAFVRGLIVVQLTLSILFVSSAFIMHRQMSYILDKDLGITQENVILIRTGGTKKGKEIYSPFEAEALGLAGVRSITATFSSYGNPLMRYTLKPEEDKSVEVGVDVADDAFLETLQIELLEGRGLSPDRPADLQNGVLVNRAFVEAMGWEDALGREIPPAQLPEGQQGAGSMFQVLLSGKQVIGVVEDFHYESLHDRLHPLALVSNSSLGNGVGTIWVRIGGERVSETLASLESTWKGVAPGEPFAYDFLDDVIRRQYETEQQWREIVDISTVIAIVLSCFGLIGLAALSAQRRAKEIGIRKVLGATVAGIVGLLSKDFLKLVVLGFILAVPLSLYAMDRWLADFAYRIELGPGIFLLAGAAALLIALASVSWQSVRAALTNPVDSLRSE